jgi:hypothetical protein
VAGPAQVLLHGHCHQRSMGLVPPAKALLSRIPGVIVVDAEAGCCGMAGSFGYGRDHYDVSKAIGERRLFPAVRGRARGHRGRRRRYVPVAIRSTISPAPSALHPAVLLRSLLPKGPAHEPGLAVPRRARPRHDRELLLRDERRRAGAGAARGWSASTPASALNDVLGGFQCSSFSRWPA